MTLVDMVQPVLRPSVRVRFWPDRVVVNHNFCLLVSLECTCARVCTSRLCVCVCVLMMSFAFVVHVVFFLV